MTKLIDLTGGRYGRLTVIKLSDKKLPSNKSKRLWECLCDCGNSKIVEGYWLTNGNIISCGCARKEHRQLGVNVRKSLDKHYTVDGVDVTKLKSKQRKGTVTGYKGVYPYNSGGYNYSAAIGFKGKLIQLGKFKTKEEAITARQSAEDKYFKPYLDKHQNRNRNDDTK